MDWFFFFEYFHQKIWLKFISFVTDKENLEKIKKIDPIIFKKAEL